MNLLKVFLLVNLIWLTACASGPSITERYEKDLKVVQTCMFNVLVGVLGSSKLGLEAFNQVCEEKEYKFYESTGHL